MKRQLRAAIARFSKEHQRYSTPEGALDKCREASGLFCILLNDEYGIRAVVDEMAIINGVAHKAVHIDDMWIDWTARQFNPDATFPHIEED